MPNIKTFEINSNSENTLKEMIVTLPNRSSAIYNTDLWIIFIGQYLFHTNDYKTSFLKKLSAEWHELAPLLNYLEKISKQSLNFPLKALYPKIYVPVDEMKHDNIYSIFINEYTSLLQQLFSDVTSVVDFHKTEFDSTAPRIKKQFSSWLNENYSNCSETFRKSCMQLFNNNSKLALTMLLPLTMPKKVVVVENLYSTY